MVIAAGTDAGTALNPLGLLVDELKLYASMGLGAAGALKSATATAGRLLGLPLGRIEPGTLADLVVVDDDPREELERLRRPRLVVAAGRLVDPRWALETALALGSEPADRLLGLERPTQAMLR